MHSARFRWTILGAGEALCPAGEERVFAVTPEWVQALVTSGLSQSALFSRQGTGPGKTAAGVPARVKSCRIWSSGAMTTDDITYMVILEVPVDGVSCLGGVVVEVAAVVPPKLPSRPSFRWEAAHAPRGPFRAGTWP